MNKRVSHRKQIARQHCHKEFADVGIRPHEMVWSVDPVEIRTPVLRVLPAVASCGRYRLNGMSVITERYAGKIDP